MLSSRAAPVLAAACCLIAVMFATRSGTNRSEREATGDRPPPAAGQRDVLASRAPAPRSRKRGDGDRATVESQGPWGTLQSFPVFIAAPDWILDMFPLPSAVTAWTFRGLTAEEVAAVIDRPGLPEAAAADLLDRSRWQVMDDAIRVLPSDITVRSLPPDVRSGIYNELARWEENEFQHSPYFIPDDDARIWLAETGLPEHLIDLVARTAYPVGDISCFSDLPLLVSATSGYAEGRTLLKALSRTQTTILRVRLDGAGDVPRIRDYWSAGPANAKDFLPLLESIATNDDVRHLDIVHLLPPTARKLLYTFPTPSMAVGGRYPDCHWTSLNFFNQLPESRLADVAGATTFTIENLHPAEPPFTYGDVLFFLDGQGNAIHSCVYLADDFVYTKNGANVLSPWLIMDLDDVRARYSRQGPVELKIYRR
jgi:hypothetical protein